MDSISEARLQLICPALSVKVHTLETMLAEENIVFRITQGLRSWSDQQKLWTKGRDPVNPGPPPPKGNIINPTEVVTNAPPGHSWHEFGLAIDVVPDDPTLAGFQCDWNEDHPAWKRLIVVGESLGLFSGSEFHSIHDDPHFQLTGRFPESPNDEVRYIFKAAGMEGVWREAGLV